MDLIEEISENKFVLVLLSEEQYEQRLAEIVRKIEKKHTGICYVCLSKPYTDTIEYLKGAGFNVEKFFFVDVLSSHYKKPEQVKNCIFVDGPSKLTDIQVAIKKAISEKDCNVVIVDTISSLLVYEQTYDILKFTHQLTIERKHQNINKVFLVLKEEGLLADYNTTLIKDVGMFADKTIDLNGKNGKLNK